MRWLARALTRPASREHYRNMNDNAPPRRPSGFVPIIGAVRDDGRVTLFRPLPRPAPPETAPRALRLVPQE